MSFGFSPGDLVMLINGLYKLTEILKKSPGEFEHLLGTFNHFCIFAKRLNIIQSAGQESDEALRNLRSEIFRVLNNFFSRIRKFEKYLGNERNRNPFALSNVVHKIEWATQVGELNALLKDLKWLVDLITSNLVIDMRILLPSTPYFIPHPIEDRFVLEDANLKTHTLSLSGISSWEALHEFLLQVWPNHERGARSIMKREYLVYNAATKKEFLPSSPHALPFTDAVAPRQRLEMSVIFPWDGQDIQKCPRSSCRKKLAVSSSGVTCECGFLVDIRPSSRNYPDPVTRIAIEDIMRRGDMQEFIRNFDAEIQQSGLANKMGNHDDIKAWLHDNLLNMSALENAERSSKKSKIRHFRRVVLCRVQWEGQERITSVKTAERTLDREMQRIKNILNAIDSRPLDAPEYVSRLLNWRNGFGNIYQGEESLRSIWTCYSQRNCQIPSSKRISQILLILDECSLESNRPFHPSILTARCLVWIYSRILALESIILLGTSKVLHETFGYWGLQDETPLPIRIASVVFIPSILLGRMTGGLIEDATALFSPEVPQYHLAAACRILKESRSLSIEYFAKKNLERYNLDLTPRSIFQYSVFTNQSVLHDWLKRYRQGLEVSLGIAQVVLQDLYAGAIRQEEEFDRAMVDFLAP